MSMRQSFIDRIYDGVDPFASFPSVEAGAKSVDDALPEGWGSSHPYFKKYIEQFEDWTGKLSSAQIEQVADYVSARAGA